jgi:hypothetical protein
VSGRTVLALRIGFVILAAFNLYVGVWAVLAPEHWYNNFPGADPRLVAAEPPFNKHLATDAGAGFLATGVIALLAAIWLTSLVAKIALVGYLSHALPHFVYHVGNPAPGLTDAENVQNTAVLGIVVIVPVVMLLVLFGRFPLPWRARGGVEASEETARSSY